jgi:hypothetical protein
MSVSNDRGMIVLIRTGPRGARHAVGECVQAHLRCEVGGARSARRRSHRCSRDVDDRPAPFLAAGAISLADLYLAPIVANVEDKAPEVLDNLASIDGWAQRAHRIEIRMFQIDVDDLVAASSLAPSRSTEPATPRTRHRRPIGRRRQPNPKDPHARPVS